MAKQAIVFSAIHLLTLVVSVVGWGQLFEPLRGKPMRFSTLICMQDNDDAEREDLHGFRRWLEHSYSKFDGDSNDPMRSFVRGEEEASVADVFDRMFDEDEEDLDPCEGEYCDIDKECEIPESFKIAPGQDSVDVMAFLGMRRAEPLRAKQDAGDWQ